MKKFSIGIIVFALLIGLNYNSVFAKDGSSDLNNNSEKVAVSNKDNNDETVEGNLSEENKVKADALKKDETPAQGTGDDSEDTSTPDQDDTTVPEDKYYDVTFINFLGEKVVKHVKEGDTVEPPMESFTDTGWRWLDENGKEFDFNTPITRNMTIIMHAWSRVKMPPIDRYPSFGIQFLVDGKSLVDEDNYNNKVWDFGYGKLKGLPVVKKEGYDFLGWFDKNGKQWKEGMEVTDVSELEEWVYIDEYDEECVVRLYARWGNIEVSDVSPKTADSNNIWLYTSTLFLSIVSFNTIRKKHRHY
jgi:hypothetical protein